MKRAGLGAICALALFWAALMSAYDKAPVEAAILNPGSFFGTALVLIALCTVTDVRWRDIGLGACLGAAACTIAGPLIANGLSSDVAYPGAAAVVGSLAVMCVHPRAGACLIAGGAQTVCLIALARRQFGLGGSKLEADPSVLLPMGVVWAVLTMFVIVRRARVGS